MGKKYAGHYTLNAGCFGYIKIMKGLSVIQKNLKKKLQKKEEFLDLRKVALALSAFEDFL